MSTDTVDRHHFLRYHLLAIGGVVLAVPCRVPQNIIFII